MQIVVSVVSEIQVELLKEEMANAERPATFEEVLRDMEFGQLAAIEGFWERNDGVRCWREMKVFHTTDVDGGVQNGVG